VSGPVILVTNDDGIRAPGLVSLARHLEAIGSVWVYAPDREQSAVSHGVSLHRPLRVTETQPQWFSVDGTPADCVMLAVRDLLPERPALVVSGVNPGANLGDDVTYSGTVAGAREGMLLGVPSFAHRDGCTRGGANRAILPGTRVTAGHGLERKCAGCALQGIAGDIRDPHGPARLSG